MREKTCNFSNSWHRHKQKQIIPKAKRFIIESVVSQEGATITKENGNENKATYSINFVKDDTITITYKEQSIYRITINTKDINGEEYINIPHSVAKAGSI